MTEDFDMENLSQAIVLGASAIGAGLAMIAGLGPVSVKASAAVRLLKQSADSPRLQAQSREQ